MNGLAQFVTEIAALGMRVEERGTLALITLDVSHPVAPELRLVATDPPTDFPLVPRIGFTCRSASCLDPTEAANPNWAVIGAGGAAPIQNGSVAQTLRGSG